MFKRLCLFASAVFFVLVGIPFAHATISNGAAAIDALGQYDDSLTNPQPVYTKGAANNGPNSLGLKTPDSVVLDAVHHRLFVSDEGNHRVLVFVLTNSNLLNSHIPGYVLGQPNFYTNASATTQTGMSSPSGLAYDAARNRLYVAEEGNNRITVFDVSTITNGMGASYVLGQPDFTTKGTALTQAGMADPFHLAFDGSGSRLFVADYGNRRVLVFSGATLSNGMNANTVIGKPDFTTAGNLTTQSGIAEPSGVAYDTIRKRLFVSEYGNRRVLVFSGATLSNGMNANTVLGQTNFTTNASATSQAGLTNTYGVSFDSNNNHIFVTDIGSNRILVYSGSTLSTGMNANTVLGQANFTTNAAATSQAGITTPVSTFYDTSKNHLFVVDQGNNRILIFSGSMLISGINATDAIGQYDDSLSNPQPVYTKGATNNAPNQYGINRTRGLALDSVHHHLFIADSNNNRVLVYTLNADNTVGSRLPSFVLGQPNFYTNAAATTQAGMNNPFSVAYDSTTNHVFVSDLSNNRVLVYSGASLSNGMNANTVLGQVDFTHSLAATTQVALNTPQQLAWDGVNNRLFVTDQNNHRVMIFNLSSMSNGMNASNVLGKANFTTTSAATTGSGMSFPDALAYDDVRNLLFVGDDGNSRVLIFNTASVANGMNASYVLGKPDFVHSGGSTSQSTFNGIAYLTYDSASKRLFVAEYGNNRVLVFNTSTITNGMRAVHVLGQPNFTTNTMATTQAGFNMAIGLTYDSTNKRLYAGDYGNNRVVAYDASPAPATLSISTPAIGGNTSVTLTDTYRDTTAAADTATITLADEDGDSEALTLSETGTGTGIFTGSMPVVHGAVLRGNGKLENTAHTSFRMTASYTDVYGSIVTATSAVITDGGGVTESGGGGGGGGRAFLAAGTSKSSTASSSSSTGQASSSTAPGSLLFSDVPVDAWFSSFVSALTQAGIVTGYKDVSGHPLGIFQPGNLVTQAEILKMALLSAGKSGRAGLPKNLSARSDWSAPYVHAAEDLGLSVYGPSLDIHLPATRGQVVQTVLEAFGIPIARGDNPFHDLPSSSPFAAAMETAAKLRIIQGDTDAQGTAKGTVRPSDPINRAEVSKIVELMRER